MSENADAPKVTFERVSFRKLRITTLVTFGDGEYVDLNVVIDTDPSLSINDCQCLAFERVAAVLTKAARREA